MAINFTDRQKEVLDARNHNILVSAAAGSGKTAVLVERILERMTEADTGDGPWRCELLVEEHRQNGGDL